MNTTILTEEALAAYGSHLRSDEKSPHTIDKYLRDAEAFRRFTRSRPLAKRLTVDYKKYLLQSGKYEDSSINSMIASLRGLLQFLGRGDCVVRNLRTQEMPFCPEDKSLTMGEYLRLLRAAEGDRRLQMILKVLFGTGIRISELGYFTVEALGKAKRGAHIRVSCKKKSREIIIPDGLREELAEYIRARRITEGVIFRTRSGRPVDRSNVWRQMKRLCGRAGVEESKVFPHNIRKLFARTFYEKTRDIAQLACLLGHSSINTTRIYVKTTELEVREKVERMVGEVLYSGRERRTPPDRRKTEGENRRCRNREEQNRESRDWEEQSYGSREREEESRKNRGWEEQSHGSRNWGEGSRKKRESRDWEKPNYRSQERKEEERNKSRGNRERRREQDKGSWSREGQKNRSGKRKSRPDPCPRT